MSRKSVKFNFRFPDWFYTFAKLSTFYNKPHWNGSIGSKDTGSWRIAKTIGNKEIIRFVWLYLIISICQFWLILLDHSKNAVTLADKIG